MRQRWLKFRLISIITLSVFVVQRAEATSYTWSGGGSDNKWSNTSNWNPSTGYPQYSSDNATFNNTSTKNCDIDATVTIGTFTVTSGYTGTITQQSGIKFTVTGAASLDGGAFVGSNGTTANDDLIFNSSFSVSGSATFKSTAATLKIEGNFTYGGGAFNANNGTVSFYQPPASIQKILTNANFANNIYNLKFEGAGSSQYNIPASGNSPLTVNGNLTIDAQDGTRLWLGYTTDPDPNTHSGAYPGPSQSITVIGNTTISGTTAGNYILIDNTINAQGNVSVTNTGTAGGGTGTIALTGSGNQTLSSSVSANHGVLPNVTINKPTGTLDLVGTLSVDHSWTYTKSGGVNPNTSTVIFLPDNLNIDAQGVDASNNPYTMAFYNLEISNAGDAQANLAGDLNVNNNFTIDASSRLWANSSYNMNVGGNWDASASGAQFFAATSTVTLNGNAAQQINAGASDFYNLKINEGSSGSVTLNSSVTVDHTLTLTSGIVTVPSGNSLTLIDDATVSGGSSASYVDGLVKKIGNDAFSFPVGDNGIYSPITISAPVPGSTTDAFTAQYHDTASPNTPVYTGGSSNVAASLLHVSTGEYWDLNRTSGSSTVNVTIGWTSADHPSTSYVTDPSDLRLSIWNGTWINAGSTSTTGNSASGTLTINSVSTFGPMTFGSITDDNPLPIVMSSFDANVSGVNVILKWITESELNNDFFTVQRSENGYSFADVLTVKSKNGNSNIRQEYSAVDYFPLSGKSYYRIEQTDFNNKRTYSEVIAVAVEKGKEKENEVVISPNPYRGTGELVLRFPTALTEQIQVRVKDTSGNDVVFKIIKTEPGNTNSVKLESLQILSPGLYFVGLIIDGQHYHSRLLII